MSATLISIAAMLNCAAKVFKAHGSVAEFFKDAAVPFNSGGFPAWFKREWDAVGLSEKFLEALDKVDKLYPFNPVKTPLVPITSLISLEKTPAAPKVESFYKTLPFSADTAFPVGKGDYKGDFALISKKFNEGLAQLSKKFKEGGENSAQRYLSGLDALFLLSFANVSAVDAVSVHIYSKVYAAFAAGLYDNPENRLTIIKGEFNGIQKFIFNEEQTSKNPSKILRGKSFYTTLLSEAARLALSRQVQTTPIINAAGLFVILAKGGCSEKLKEVKSTIQNWLYERYYATVSFSIGWLEGVAEDMAGDFTKIWRKLSDRLEADKASKFDLNQRAAVFSNYLDNFRGDKLCPYCGREPATVDGAGDAMCPACAEYAELGKTLATGGAKTITFYESSEKAENNFFGQISYKDSSGQPPDKIIMEIDIDSAYIKTDDNHKPLTFDELARESGSTHLAALKADIDNLGKIFALGLRDNLKKASLFHIAELSFRLNIFFTYILQKSAKGKNIYMVFAGGDDLFAIGSRDDILEFSLLVSEKLSEYTAGGATISSGITLFNPHTPVWFIAKQTEDILFRAKEQKNTLAIFEAVLGYNEFKEEREALNAQFKSMNALSSSFYYKLLNIAERRNRYEQRGEAEGLLWDAHLRYTLARMKLSENERDNALKVLSRLIDEKTGLFNALISLKIYEERSKRVGGKDGD
ncbi:MAG: hypothetical protein LBP51_07440 [Deferribacteraceae bacterium]|nr:hypothetical protein [Deferribacteraceae bacterium]